MEIDDKLALQIIDNKIDDLQKIIDCDVLCEDEREWHKVLQRDFRKQRNDILRQGGIN